MKLGPTPCCKLLQMNNLKLEARVGIERFLPQSRVEITPFCRLLKRNLAPLGSYQNLLGWCPFWCPPPKPSMPSPVTGLSVMGSGNLTPSPLAFRSFEAESLKQDAGPACGSRLSVGTLLDGRLTR